MMGGILEAFGKALGLDWKLEKSKASRFACSGKFTGAEVVGGKIESELGGEVVVGCIFSRSCLLEW